MPLVVENCIYNFCDGSCFIRASVHIIHWDGTLEFLCSQPVLLYIVMVHELAGGSAVYERGPRLDLSGISGLNFHLDDQGLRPGVAATTYCFGSCLSHWQRWSGWGVGVVFDFSVTLTGDSA